MTAFVNEGSDQRSAALPRGRVKAVGKHKISAPVLMSHRIFYKFVLS